VRDQVRTLMAMNTISSGAYISLPPAAWIAVEGEDAPTFLQSQFTADLRVPVGQAVPGLWLDHRGRIHGESVVLKTGEETFLIASLTTPAATLMQKLEGHVIADEVDFSDEKEGMVAVVSFGGSPSETQSKAFVYENTAYIFEDRIGTEAVRVWVGPEASCREFSNTLSAQGWRKASAGEWKSWRLRTRRPAVPAEVGPGETPAMVGLEALCALTKGCYLGQEVVNRQARLERASQSLQVVRLEGDLAAAGDPFLPVETGEGKAVGELRSWAVTGSSTIGLAVLRNKYLQQPLFVVCGATHRKEMKLHGAG
jgi:folate-binding protein YgfZ